jgi:hypothetical protein
MKKHLSVTLAAGCLLAAHLPGNTFLSDAFDYMDGALAGQGTWARGVNSPTADNPSDYLVVSNGAVRFDWTTGDPVNNVVRHLWGTDDAVTTGSIYGIFDLKVLQAPLLALNVRPGFLSFADGAGSQQRGFVGIQAGTAPGTFQLGISSASQLGSNFAFSSGDLALDTVYSVMIGFNVETQDTALWINSVNPADSPLLSQPGGGSNNGIRRVNLRLYNSDGEGGVTNLGIFEMDNLTVTTVPEPATWAMLTGLLALTLVIRRQRR